MAHVLLADDDRDLAEAVGWYLEAQGIRVTRVHDGPSALDVCQSAAPDAVVLDIMMPGLDGFEVCRRLRRFSDAPILILSAREGEADKVRALGIGADDYVTKPFGPMELVARVKALLRRAGALGSRIVRRGGIALCPTSREVTANGEPLDLTRTEFDILHALMRGGQEVLSRGRLIEVAWGEALGVDERLVDSHVYHLREKLASAGIEPSPIVTVRGVGYAFRPRI